jgi:hypothetical protein
MKHIRVWFSIIDLNSDVRLAFHREKSEEPTDPLLWAPATPFADINSLRTGLAAAGLPTQIADCSSSPLNSYLVTETQLRHLGFHI